MTIELEHLPPRLAGLPEPARARAVEVANAMIDEGVSEEDAIERACTMASQWVFERAPGDRSEVACPGTDLPKREPVPPARPRPRARR